MLYMTVCESKKAIPESAKPEDIVEWKRICTDDQINRRCKMIKCFKPMSEGQNRLILMFETDDSEVINLISRDFGNEWRVTSFPLRRINEIPSEDHSIVPG